MSNQINDGGPAFPHPELDFEVTMDDGRKAYRCYQASSGMTLRDYFAAAALQGLIADGGGASWEVDANAAYKAADAMLKAREAK